MSTSHNHGNLENRIMNTDDMAEVFHLGENLFTSEFSPSMHLT